MRSVFVAGLALGAVLLVASFAIRLLNVADDWSVAAGYLILLALVAVLSGVFYRVWRRL